MNLNKIHMFGNHRAHIMQEIMMDGRPTGRAPDEVHPSKHLMRECESATYVHPQNERDMSRQIGRSCRERK